MVKKMFSIIIFALIIVGVGVLLSEKSSTEQEVGKSTASINGFDIKVDISDTIDKQIQGLSGRESLAEDGGMLFVYEKPKKQVFWMKNMNFPLDFIFIEGEQVVEIIEDVPPEGGNPEKRVISENEVSQVLEVNAGFVKKHNIKIGDSVYLK